MNEFIEKLIGRLEGAKSQENTPIDNIWNNSVNECICRVNQLAEEHKDNVTIDGQYCWQTCGATEHCKECNRLCNGSIDYYENYDCLLEE